MSVSFQESETLKNLMRAFAGEAQACTRYTMAAKTCRAQQLPVLEAVFRFTARQELAHARIFSRHLAPYTGPELPLDAAYPVPGDAPIPALLRQAQHGEWEEHQTVYPAFAETARQEGFSAAASSFRHIAAIEGSHSRRFGQLADLMEQGRLFVSDADCGWMCLHCGHILSARSAPGICPVCHHEQGFFIRLELAPYSASSLLSL